MTRAQFEHAIRAAGAVLGVNEVLVIGSQALHGCIADGLPAEAQRSIAADVAGLHDPDGRQSDRIDGSIGEALMFYETFGYYAHGSAHSLGVIHRDIKPENILLQGGHALVSDFGIALAVQTAGGARLTQTGVSIGTPQYMSPEQAMGERSLDARSDIYALGAVTYEMLVGAPPFVGPTAQAIVAKVMTERPTAPSVSRQTVTPGIEHAVMTALAKSPADRYAT